MRVTTDTTTDPAQADNANEVLSAEALANKLFAERKAEAVRRADELERRRAEAAHARALADVDEEDRRHDLDRDQREGSVSADAALSRLYRDTHTAGERARIASTMARAGETRAMLLVKARRGNLRSFLPLLLACAIWSTSGVQAGCARLMNIDSHDVTWWALWLLEPVLIGIVARLIIVRAVLAAAGGKLSDSSENIGYGVLAASIALNLISAIPAHMLHTWGEVSAMIGSMFAHAVGPVGAAIVAHLIGSVDKDLAEADPWTGSPRLADVLPENALPTSRRADVLTSPDTTDTGSDIAPDMSDDLENQAAETNAEARSTDIAEGDRAAAETESDDDQDEGNEVTNTDRLQAVKDMLLIRPDLTGPQIGAVLGVSARQGLRLKNQVLAAASKTTETKINGHRLGTVDAA